MNFAPPLSPSPTLDAVKDLITRAQHRANNALTAWNDNDYDSACVMAPIAVELLGKAALWSINPALLASVTGNDGEKSLVTLGRVY